MTIKDVISHLDNLAPLSTAEDFDNVGLLVGDKNTKVSGVLVTLDTLEDVVEEAITSKCNLIVSFHPIIFKGLKRLTGKNYVERTVLKAIQHNIAIYAIHTALDNSFNGVNAMMCKKLGVTKQHVLIPKQNTIKKLVTYVPLHAVENVKQAVFNVGAGHLGNYEDCSFSLQGQGTFKGNSFSNPVIGKPGKRHTEEETQLSITFKSHLESKVLSALFKEHPYEEVAYEISTLENTNQHIGMGMIGTFETAMPEQDFLNHVKSTFTSQGLRHSKHLNKPIKTIALLGGSGSFAISAAKAKQVDAFITADLKYHDFFQAEDHILLIDIGHYESEQYTKELLHSYIRKKFTNFAIVLSKTQTNPIKYL